MIAAAKQEAFEESIRLKNQFRNLDEDEVEFLDSVLESTRAKEEAVKKETREQLEIFRRQQEETDQTLIRSSENEGRQLGTSHNTVSTSDEPQWTVSARKRKRAMEREFLKGVKLRKSLSTRDPLTATTHMQVSMQPPVTVEAASNELGADTGDPNDGASVDQLSLTAAKSASDREIEAQTSVYASLERSGSRKAGQVLDLGLVDYASDAD